MNREIDLRSYGDAFVSVTANPVLASNPDIIVTFNHYFFNYDERCLYNDIIEYTVPKDKYIYHNYNNLLVSLKIIWVDPVYKTVKGSSLNEIERRISRQRRGLINHMEEFLDLENSNNLDIVSTIITN